MMLYFPMSAYNEARERCLLLMLLFPSLLQTIVSSRPVSNIGHSLQQCQLQQCKLNLVAL